MGEFSKDREYTIIHNLTPCSMNRCCNASEIDNLKSQIVMASAVMKKYRELIYANSTYDDLKDEPVNMHKEYKEKYE